MGIPLFPFQIDRKYTATKLLGKGGGGYALLAKKGSQRVVVKLLKPGLAFDKTKIERRIQKFKKEFLTLKKLNHPHIGKLYDFGFDEELNQYYFAGEYIAGEDIRKVCGNLPPEKIEKLFVQALQALHYLHTFGRAGLRHNDIKTANIMVTHTPQGELQLKLIDFGLTSFSTLDIKGGTASYMAPEQIAATFPEKYKSRGLPKPDHRADLYALGVVWYFCLTGVNPFYVLRNTEATLEKHFGPIPLPPSDHRKSIPKYIDTVVLKLLKQHPEERFESAARVIEEICLLGEKNYSVIPSQMRAFYLPEGEWVDQEQIWKPLKEAWKQISSGENPQPALFWIVGDRGQGKTNALLHFKNYVQSNEGRMLLLEQQTEKASKEWREDLEQFCKERSKPLVVAVDDCSADHPAMGKLEPLWDSVQYALKWDPGQKQRILFLLTTDIIPYHSQEHGLPSHNLYLKNFSKENLNIYLQKLSSKKGTDIPQGFVQQLMNHTGGNPLFVTEVLKSMGEEGLLFDDSGQWHPNLYHHIDMDFEKLPVPQDMEEVLKESWERLTPEEQKQLKWAACFPSGVSQQDLLQLDTHLEPFTLESLISKGLLNRNKKEEITFANSFFHRTVEKAIDSKERIALHEHIGHYGNARKKPMYWTAYHFARIPNHRLQISSLETLARFYTETNRLEEACKARKELSLLLQEKSFAQQAANILNTLRLLREMRRYKEAFDLAEHWITKAAKRKNVNGWHASLLRERGLIHLKQELFTKARHDFEKALTVIGKNNKHLTEKLILHNSIARTWLDEREIPKAVRIYTQTRKTAKKLKPLQQQEVLNNELGLAYYLAQEGEKALRCLEEDIRLFEQAGDKTRRIRALYLLGGIHRTVTRRFNDAVAYYQKSIELAEDLKNADWMMRSFNGMAATYLDRAQEKGQKTAYTQALRYFEESLAICRRLRKDLKTLDNETAVILQNIGTVHRELGNFSKAHDAFNTIITVLGKKENQNSRDKIRLCETYIGLADVFSGEDHFDKMNAPIEKAWKIAKTSRHLREHQMIIQLLMAEQALGLKQKGALKKHLAAISELQEKYAIRPTPFAQKRLERLMTKR